MKTLKLFCYCTTIIFVMFIITNMIVILHENRLKYETIVEENRQINLILEQDCIKYNTLDYCDKFQSNYKCREIKALAMDLADKDRNDSRDRTSYIHNHDILIKKYNEECLNFSIN